MPREAVDVEIAYTILGGVGIAFHAHGDAGAPGVIVATSSLAAWRRGARTTHARGSGQHASRFTCLTGTGTIFRSPPRYDLLQFVKNVVIAFVLAGAGALALDSFKLFQELSLFRAG